MTATLVDHAAVQLALRARLRTLPGLPPVAYEDGPEYVPVSGTPYIREQYVPATVTLRGLSSSGPVETTGMYVLTWFAPAGGGMALARNVTALLALFPPGVTITAADGTWVRIRGEPAPYRDQQVLFEPGWAAITVTIPFRIIQ